MYAKAVWADESFDEQLLATLAIYKYCIEETMEKRRPSLVRLSEILEGVGMTVINAATLLLVADELMSNFIGVLGAIKNTEVV